MGGKGRGRANENMKREGGYIERESGTIVMYIASHDTSHHIEILNNILHGSDHIFYVYIEGI